MKRTLLIALIAVLTAGCDRQTELSTNTEEYFAAHGIVQGKPNELRIGGTLFRFPAGVGLNPETAQSEIRWFDGRPETIRTLSSKQCLEQDKCEIVVTPIVKGHADKVTFYLEPMRGYAPNPSPFGGGVRVEISHVDDGYAERARKSFSGRITGVEGVAHSEWGLRQYQPYPKGRGGDLYEGLSDNIVWPNGERVRIGCQSDGDPELNQNLPPSGVCGMGYVVSKGNFLVSMEAGKVFMREHWQEIVPVVVRFVDSAVIR